MTGQDKFAENPSPESRELADFIDPISQERLQQMVDQFSRELGVDLSFISVRVVRPGDLSFDFLEILSKFQGKYGLKKVVPQLLTHGIDFNKPFEHSPNNIKKMREAAFAEGLPIDGVLSGFVYNTSGNIFYTAIKADHLQELAETYSRKEREEKNFPTLESAREYMNMLAEKYLYHEIGHSVLRLMPISDDDLQAWAQTMSSDTVMQEEIIDLQKDKFPTADRKELIQIILHESFAEIFSRVATQGKADARLTSHPEAEELMKRILQKLGFKL